jgi:hypothetical protein
LSWGWPSQDVSTLQKCAETSKLDWTAIKTCFGGAQVVMQLAADNVVKRNSRPAARIMQRA